MHAQKSCQTSCKEGMLHAATYLTALLQQKLQRKLYHVALAIELGSTFSNDCRDFLKPPQVAARDCNVFFEAIGRCSPRLQCVTLLMQLAVDSFCQRYETSYEGNCIACNTTFSHLCQLERVLPIEANDWITSFFTDVWRKITTSYFSVLHCQELQQSTSSVFAHIFTKFKYFAKQFIPMESPDHLLLNNI